MSIVIDEWDSHGIGVPGNRVCRNVFYQCLVCGSRSPSAPNEDMAYELATKRTEPPRTPIELSDLTWLCVPYFAEYKGVKRLFIYVTGSGISADFAAARELGWKGKVLKEFLEWEKQHGKLQVRLWEAKNSPPTDEERAAAPWKEPWKEV